MSRTTLQNIDRILTDLESDHDDLETNIAAGYYDEVATNAENMLDALNALLDELDNLPRNGDKTEEEDQ